MNRKAFTLIEVLIVMAIMGFVGGAGISGYLSLQRTQAIEQQVLDFKDNLEYAKHSALVLKKQNNEFWVYGIGVYIDYRSKTYRLFKLCDRSAESYRDFSSSSMSELNYVVKSCNGNADGVSFESLNTLGFDKRINSIVCKGYQKTAGGSEVIYLNIQYVVFESVSGKAHFYDSNKAEVSSLDRLSCTIVSGNRQRYLTITNGSVIKITPTLQ